MAVTQSSVAAWRSLYTHGWEEDAKEVLGEMVEAGRAPATAIPVVLASWDKLLGRAPAEEAQPEDGPLRGADPPRADSGGYEQGTEYLDLQDHSQ